MKETKVKIGGTLSFESVVFDNGEGMASFDFTERSPAHGYSDTETSIDIDRETAERLVSALREHFGF